MSKGILGVIGALILVAGAYWLGRRDAPDPNDQLINSLMDGVNAYAKEREKDKELLQQQWGLIQTAQRLSIAMVRRADSIENTRVPLPTVVPANCAPWATNLTKCDQEKNELKGALTKKDEAIAAAGRLKAIAESRARADSARADSSDTALKDARKGDYILGIKLPSRKTSFAAGSFTTLAVEAIVCLLSPLC